MNNLPQSKVDSPAKPHEFVRLYLDVGQCRYIHAVLSEKFNQLNAQHLVDKNDALEQLLWHFKSFAYPSVSKPLHKDDSLDKYIDDADPDSLADLLSAIYVDGVLHVN